MVVHIARASDRAAFVGERGLRQADQSAIGILEFDNGHIQSRHAVDRSDAIDSPSAMTWMFRATHRPFARFDQAAH